MAQRFNRGFHFVIVCLFWEALASTSTVEQCDMVHDGTSCNRQQLENQEDRESAAVKMELLQSHKYNRVQTKSSVDVGTNSTRLQADVETTSGSDAVSLVRSDHNDNLCMLCGKPLAERVDREYTEFRTDCGGMSSPTGPNASTLSMPVATLTQISESGVVINGFCQINFAKSCVDAVANKDYLYWAKSIDLKAPEAYENAAWDGRYCRLNGFLEANMVALQHDFESTRAKADELCKTKYARYNPGNITFKDMMSTARYDDKSAPTANEAELLAAWNCAMGDLGCDMALCAYSFCQKGTGTGLYDECEGWHPIHGMPSP